MFNWGFVPDQTKTLAQAVDALDGYDTLIQRFEMTSLTSIEQQVVYIATSRINQCGYCVAAHSEIADKAGMAASDLDALRRGLHLTSDRLEALRRLTCAIVEGKGRVPKNAVDAFVAAVFRQEQVFEILIGIAAKMFSNFFNQIAGTPLEPELEAYAWSPPIVEIAERPAEA